MLSWLSAGHRMCSQTCSGTGENKAQDTFSLYKHHMHIKCPLFLCEQRTLIGFHVLLKNVQVTGCDGCLFAGRELEA